MRRALVLVVFGILIGSPLGSSRSDECLFREGAIWYVRFRTHAPFFRNRHGSVLYETPGVDFARRPVVIRNP